MRPYTYYLIAVVLLLLTVPMYHYIFTHGRVTDYSQSTVAREHVSLARSKAPVAATKPRLLLSGEICKHGLVYLASGNGYVPAKSFSGAAVQCRAGHVVSANDATDGQSSRELKTWYAYGEKLPEGYKCSAADGPVYRTRIEKRATVIEPLVRGGIMVHCGGDERSSHR